MRRKETPQKSGLTSTSSSEEELEEVFCMVNARFILDIFCIFHI